MNVELSNSQSPDTQSWSLRLSRLIAGGIALDLGLTRRLRLITIEAGLGLILAVIALPLSVALAAATLAAGEDARFWIWGLLNALAHLQIWLAAVTVTAWFAVREAQRLNFIALLLCAQLLPGLAWMLFDDFNLGAWLSSGVDYRLMAAGLGLWQAALCIGALTRFGANWWRALIGCVIYICSLTAIVYWLPPIELYFRAANETEAAIDVESAYYRQAALLDRQLRSLKPQREGKIDLYAISVAAYGDQDVFKHEALGAAEVIERHLGARGRSVRLINNATTVETYPLANQHNIDRTLSTLAEIINPDEDIVLVFLTSHGYEDGTLSTRFESMGLNDIVAQALQSSFQSAGIHWRVVIVSACYSGSFVEPLADPYTLVMTAAAPDRSSFGCRQGNRWTYFGRALFDQALRHTQDLEQAFREATELVARQELAEDKTPSHPQMSLGSKMTQHLRRWYAQ